MARNSDSGLNWPPELRHPLVLVCAATYALLYLNRHWGHQPLPALVSSYLADMLALPLLLTVALTAMRRLYFRQPAFTLPLSWVAGTWALLSVWFEVLLPWWRPGTTVADPLDAAAYALGGLIFWCWLNRPAAR